MFTWMNKQGVRSNQGFEVQFTGRLTAEYREGMRYFVVDVEDSDNGQIAFNENAFERWANSPIRNDPTEQARIRQNFMAALEFQGLRGISKRADHSLWAELASFGYAYSRPEINSPLTVVNWFSMQDYYAARAKKYDQVYSKPERQDDLRRMEAWLPEALAGRHVLELACGTGYWTQFYAPAALQVVGIDSSRETLDIAQARIPANVQLLQGDAYHLPPLDIGFDACFAGFWWSHIPLQHVPAFLESLHASLRPGAKVIFMDNRFVPGSSTPISERTEEGDTYQQRSLDDGSIHRVLKNFPNADELLRNIEPYSIEASYRQWAYFWALEYTLK